MARVLGGGGELRKWIRLVGILLLLVIFAGAVIAGICRPLPPIHISKHHPHTVTWATNGGIG